MKAEYLSELSFYIRDGKLPVSISAVYGDHPQKLFHSHNYTELVLITAGSPIHMVENEICKVSAGDVLLIHPGTVHGYDQTAGADIVNLIFDTQKLPLPRLDSGELSIFEKIFSPDEKYVSARPLMHLDPEELSGITGLITNLDDELKNIHPGGMFFSLALFMQILTRLSRQSSIQQPGQRIRFMVGNALKYMNKHYPEKITLGKLAKLSCMSERSFQRHFQQTVGSPPMNYLLDIRLRHVQNLLITSDSEIGTIALDCGFYDSNYLCKKFKEAFGMTPSQFRSEHQLRQ
ncbi:MAG: helix-turn-helix domain-containing protein [Lentisphaeria bacterium]|nr:helix-turn-helix domain-containing protein [Lentisphaeria bacterium]